MLKAIAGTDKANYPEMLGKMFIVNGMSLVPVALMVTGGPARLTCPVWQPQCYFMVLGR